MRSYCNRELARAAAKKGVAAAKYKRETVMANTRRIARELKQQGHTLAEIADTLNEQGIKTYLGKRFTISTVRALFAVYDYADTQPEQ